MAQTAEQTPTLKEIMERERDRLTERRKDVVAELESLDAEIAGINAYFDAMSRRARSDFKLTPPNPRRVDNRHPRGFVQSTVLKTITEHPQGLTRAELIKFLAEENIGEQSISNALGALTDAKKITAPPTRGGKYHPATAEVPTAPDQPSS
jgi:hypothetical protein